MLRTALGLLINYYESDLGIEGIIESNSSNSGGSTGL